MRLLPAFLLVIFSLRAVPSSAQSLVAETPPLTAEEQLKRFHLPRGFEIQLVAHEPDIHKPMNMKFDGRGKLWVTHSVEYPFPAASDDRARDAISVLSDFAPDGRARKVQRFADHLNIPIGVLPLGDADAIAWSIPNIYRLTDSNGDGTADMKSIALGPFGVVDVHGNQNAFTRWVDGWVYANHGFSNDSHVKIAGHGEAVLHMHSGNTYRFKPDGSAIEQYSWGQVNPFGLSFDALGNLYSADCHSSAVSMLLRGGHYQSFGKPHDGLGFAPVMTNIDHGGTGIAGVAYSTLPDFPPAFRDVLFVGNVITNRVHCDRLKWFGSTPVVDKVEDFITCDDPWFRPVDLQIGPDGALYIADFYNCIIGHYEVPLDHPKRDRQRGRIWRVIYTGEPSSPAAGPMPDLHALEAKELFAFLSHPNLAVRVLATNRLVDEFPQQAAAMASEVLAQTARAASEGRHDPKGDALPVCHAIWVMQRTSGVSPAIAADLLSSSISRDVQTHLTKAVGETDNWRPWHHETVQAALSNPDSFVRRAAADALSRHPAVGNVAPLLSALDATDPKDEQLYHQTRLAIRNQLSSPAVARAILDLPLSPAERAQLVAFAVNAPSGPAAMLVFDEALVGHVSDEALLRALPTAARHVDAPRVEEMITHVERRFASDHASRFVALKALAKGSLQSGNPLSERLRAQLTALIKPAISGDLDVDWYNSPLDRETAAPSPWVRQQRPSTDGSVLDMISSLSQHGERAGGVLCSPAFEVPAHLSFWMSGHNGFPNEPDRQLNYVRLLLNDGTEVARSYPPREDTAHRYEWDLRSHMGRRGRIEVIDGMTDCDAFAWLAVADFEPSVASLLHIAIEDKQAARLALIQLVGEMGLESLKDEIIAMAGSADEDSRVRLAAANALFALDASLAIAPLGDIVADPSHSSDTRAAAAEQLGQIDQADARAALLGALPSAPQSLASAIAASAAARRESAHSLLRMIEDGKASATLLLEPVVLERLRLSEAPNLNERVAKLTEGLETADDRIVRLIAKRRAAYVSRKCDPEKGRAVFAKSVCASCHRIGSVGSTIGPALDGIGNRGLDRLLEDTLDPNRNVDPAFRAVNILTEAGRVFSGFGVREEGSELVFNDAHGEEVRVPMAEVIERTPSALSPMPSNVADQMPEDDYYALFDYLLSLKQE